MAGFDCFVWLAFFCFSQFWLRFGFWIYRLNDGFWHAIHAVILGRRDLDFCLDNAIINGRERFLECFGDFEKTLC